MPKVLVMPVIGAQSVEPDSTEDVITEVYQLWCPACNDALHLNDSWKFNGDLGSPTFEKEIHTMIQDRICHAKITDGVWHYFEDSTHDFAGKDLTMVDVPAVIMDSTHV